MQLRKFFQQDAGLLALTSGGSVDFSPADFDSPLSERQRAYLYKNSSVDIPRVFWRKQVHEDTILEARGPSVDCKGLPDADAYITDEKNLPIAIRTADCVPVFIFDPEHKAIGLAHAGWKGTRKSIAAKTIQKMKERYKSRPEALKIALGPSIRNCCYQVGKEFHDHFPQRVGWRDGFLYLDLPGANIDQLVEAGVRPWNIVDSGACTCCSKNYFSFRREGDRAGRMISLMMLQ